MISHQKSCLKNESVQDNICSKCGSSFTLKRNLIRHENRESCKRKLVEDINYGSNDTDHISRAKKLNTDLNEQINSTQAECEVDQSITTPIIYDEPTQISNYDCTYCKTRFKSKKSLNVHDKACSFKPVPGESNFKLRVLNDKDTKKLKHNLCLNPPEIGINICKTVCT